MSIEPIVLSSEPVAADAVVILAGEDGGPRCEHGAKLFLNDWAHHVVATGGLDDASKMGALRMRGRLMALGVAPARIIVDDAANTREQAERVIALAETNGWHRLILVASAYHQTRAFLTFLKVLQEKKLEKEIRLINAPVKGDWFGSPQGVPHSRWQLRKEEAKKLLAYAGHVASEDDGLVYLAYWSGVQVAA